MLHLGILSSKQNRLLFLLKYYLYDCSKTNYRLIELDLHLNYQSFFLLYMNMDC